MIKTQQEMLQMLSDAVVNMEDEAIGDLAKTISKWAILPWKGLTGV
ncbi:MAG: hypothetical protein RJR35_02040 [Thermoanaerobacterales bacterium]|nr:hypothetical protein [Thermoanaerobacterales bacterium]